MTLNRKYINKERRRRRLNKERKNRSNAKRMHKGRSLFKMCINALRKKYDLK